MAQTTLLTLFVPQKLQLLELDRQIASISRFSLILVALSQGLPTKHGYSLVQGKLYYKNILVLPIQSDLITLILHDCHDSPVGSHSVLKTLKRVSAIFYQKGMKRDIQSYVVACAVCHQNKYSTLSNWPSPASAHTASNLGGPFLGFY